jgi:hypothetical protein
LVLDSLRIQISQDEYWYNILEVNKKITVQLNAWLPVLLWALIIFKLSSGSVPSISTVYIQDFIFKKGAHMFFFGMLGVLFYRALKINNIRSKNAVLLALLFVFLYGTSDEFHQSFTQGREARIRDVGFDGLGGAIALCLTYYILPLLPKNLLSIFKQLNLT